MDDYETSETGTYEYLWTHAIISDEIYEGIVTYCNFSKGATRGSECDHYTKQATVLLSNIDHNDIYTPLCSPLANSTPSVRFNHVRINATTTKMLTVHSLKTCKTITIFDTFKCV